MDGPHPKAPDDHHREGETLLKDPGMEEAATGDTGAEETEVEDRAGDHPATRLVEAIRRATTIHPVTDLQDATTRGEDLREAMGRRTTLTETAANREDHPTMTT